MTNGDHSKSSSSSTLEGPEGGEGIAIAGSKRCAGFR